MKIEEFILLLVAGIFIVLFFAISFASRNASKDEIMKYLTRRGASNIQIEHNLFDSDRDTMTFYIRYTGIKGNPQSATCKARSGIFDAGGLFWSDLPELNPLPGEATPAMPNNDIDQLSEKIRARSTIELPTYQIVKMLPILGSEDQIVLLDAGYSFHNLLRCHADGKMVWKAELPTTVDDVYTDVEWRDGELTAVSKSLATVTLNLKTGKIL